LTGVGGPIAGWSIGVPLLRRRRRAHPAALWDSGGAATTMPRSTAQLHLAAGPMASTTARGGGPGLAMAASGDGLGRCGSFTARETSYYSGRDVCEEEREYVGIRILSPRPGFCDSASEICWTEEQ